jgi:hypothetical protein
MPSRLTRAVRPLTASLALLVALALTSAAAGSAAAVSSTNQADGITEVSAAAGNVAKNDLGKMSSTVKGKTSDGGKLGGTFTPLKFKNRSGVPSAKGVLDGVITHADGSKSKFTAIRWLEVTKINGKSLSGATASGAQLAACDILNLVLGPLDLNVLGLEIHLNRVVLDIIAVPGPGNLLGNLLCAVAGLLDGGPLAGLLGQLIGLLNQILDALGLGV